MDKSVIRKIMKEKRLMQSLETFSLYNQIVIEKLKSHPVYQKSSIIGCYVSLPQEIQTLELIQEALKTHRICTPKVEGDIMHFYEITSLDDLQKGCFQVLEPITTKRIDPDKIDLMIVPLLAYDKNCYRVGYGKGYYDKYFKSGCKAYKIGLAYSFQYVDQIITDQFDVALDEILTERERKNE